MAATEVYSSTTQSMNKPPQKFFIVPTETMDLKRFLVKVLEVLLSFVAFILEEVVTSCMSCTSLYIFEFVSCTAFLFTALLLVLLATKLHTRVGINCWPAVDFIYTALMATLFFIASAAFASDNGRSALEKSAVAFGFLSTVAFVADAFLFFLSNGNPIKGRQQPHNGPSAASPAEAERLNSPVDQQE